MFILLGIATNLIAAEISDCEEPTSPTTCHGDPCSRLYCLGPENTIVNAPICPLTCNGDWTVSLNVLYFQAHQDGMEFALDNGINVAVLNPTTSEIQNANRIIDAQYLTPKTHFDFGYRFGVGYCLPCDGWRLSLDWTHFQTTTTTHNEAETNENHVLLTLWSAFAPEQGNPIFARDIKTSWKLIADLVDGKLSRPFWVGSRLTFTPSLFLRYVELKQKYDLFHAGGSWSPRANPTQNPFTNTVNLRQKYCGFGPAFGLDTTWLLGCGFGLYGNLATSILYGKFALSHDESNRLGVENYDKTKILETKEYLRISRATLDLAFGLQWQSLFADCKYGVTARIGYEQHLFFHQNQLWRVNRIDENDFIQKCGTLDLQGWVLNIIFDF